MLGMSPTPPEVEVLLLNFIVLKVTSPSMISVPSSKEYPDGRVWVTFR